MKSLSLLVSLLLLVGCNPNYTSYANMEQAFTSGCRVSTIVSSINVVENNKLELKATCERLAK